MVVDTEEIPDLASVAALDAMVKNMEEGFKWQMLLR